MKFNPSTGTSPQEIALMKKDIGKGGGGGEPSAYIKNAAVSGDELTLTKKNNSTVKFSRMKPLPEVDEVEGPVYQITFSSGETGSTTINLFEIPELPLTAQDSFIINFDKNPGGTGSISVNFNNNHTYGLESGDYFAFINGLAYYPDSGTPRVASLFNKTRGNWNDVKVSAIGAPDAPVSGTLFIYK